MKLTPTTNVKIKNTQHLAYKCLHGKMLE